MSTKAKVSADQLLEAASQLNPGELEQFVTQVIALQARRRAPSVTKTETELLMKINNGLPTDVRARYWVLIGKRQEESLTEEEYEELLRLSDQTEQLQVERLEALIELAQLRGTTLDALMDSLGIKAPPVQ